MKFSELRDSIPIKDFSLSYKKKPDEKKPPTEGWAWPINASKAHYFVNGESLCRKWMYLAKLDSQESLVIETPDDCLECRKKLKKRLAVNER